MEMRRKDRVFPQEEAMEFLRNADIGYLSMAVDNTPYAVPLNFVVIDNTIYFHCALKGRKLDMLDANPKCCFAVSILDSIKAGQNACDYGAFYRSAIVEGTARRVTDASEKVNALNKLTEKYAVGHRFNKVTEEAAKSVVVIGIHIDSISGKARR